MDQSNAHIQAVTIFVGDSDRILFYCIELIANISPRLRVEFFDKLWIEMFPSSRVGKWKNRESSLGKSIDLNKLS